MGCVVRPVPRQQFVEPIYWMIGDAGENVSKPSLGINVVEFCGLKQCVHQGSPVAAAFGTGEQPCPAAEGDTAKRALGGVVAETYAAVAEEAGEGVPAFEHVIHSLGGVSVPREPGALGTHPYLQIPHQRRDMFLAISEAPFGGLPVDRVFMGENSVDLPDGVQRDRRD